MFTGSTRGGVTQFQLDSEQNVEVYRSGIPYMYPDPTPTLSNVCRSGSTCMRTAESDMPLGWPDLVTAILWTDFLCQALY